MPSAVKSQQSSKARIQNAKAKLAEGDAFAAERDLAPAMGEDPDSSEGWIVRGDLYFFYGLYEEAVTAYRKAFELDPGSMAAYLGFVDALLMLGKMAEAQELFKEAGANPEEALKQRLEVLMERGKKPPTKGSQ